MSGLNPDAMNKETKARDEESDEATLFEFLIDEVDGETHDIEIGAMDGGAGDVAYPLLNTVGTGFVERFIAVYIIADFVVGKLGKGDVRFIDISGKKHLSLALSQREGGKFLGKRDGGIDLVRLTGECAEHGESFCFVMGFAEHMPVRPDDCIRRDEELVRKEPVLVRARLRTRDIIRNIACLEFRRASLVRVNGDCRERDAQTAKQFAPARALRA